MNDAGNARQQIVEKIKESSNILVTVSTNPSVDELSAALGLTLMLNKLNKHATAVVSGDIPAAINFLDPAKTFENTIDSLRDFIIALDKDKADHLRYKVDGDVVKIFITPYRTTITDEDLEFSQGDYNVELVLALGVRDKDHLDKALESHGRILHDAAVATIGASPDASNLGSIDWKDAGASSLCEMLVSLSEAIKGDKALLDEQSSTALLTGIVAATDRFSNSQTSPKVMTMAAQLMAAGANQQLIAAKLEDANEIGPETKSEKLEKNADGTVNITEDAPTKIVKKQSSKVEEPVKKADDNAGTLAISHELEGDIDQVADQVAKKQAEASRELVADKLELAAKRTSAARTVDAALEAEQRLEAELSAVAPTPPAITEPSLGGTLNATAEKAAEDKRREEDEDRNKTLLSHGSGPATKSPSIMQEPEFHSAFNAASQVDSDEPPTVDPFATPSTPLEPEVMPSVEVKAPTIPGPPQPQSPTTLAELDAKNRAPTDDARADVDAVFDMPGQAPQTASELPPLPDFSTLPPPPPLPDFSQPVSVQPTGALPPERLADIFTTQPTTPVSPDADNPEQFKIPGQ